MKPLRLLIQKESENHKIHMALAKKWLGYAYKFAKENNMAKANYWADRIAKLPLSKEELEKLAEPYQTHEKSNIIIV